MAQITFRASVLTNSMPRLTSDVGRTVIVPNLDKYTLGGGASSDIDPVTGTRVTQQQSAPGFTDQPQVVYMHNVLATTWGLQSIGYDSLFPATANTHFSDIYLLRGTGNSILYFAPLPAGYAILKSGDAAWTIVVDAQFTGQKVSIAYVQQHTYVCLANTAVFEFDPATGAKLAVVLLGVDPLLIDGIVSSGNYLAAYTEDTIMWSSVINPLDMVPSLETGAGSEMISAQQGKITHCSEITGGFLIYTTSNIIAAVASGNIRYPWSFPPVSGVAGAINSANIAANPTGLYHYVYTSAGIAKVSKTLGDLVLTEVSDFLAGKKLEDLDGSNNIVQVASIAPLISKLTVIGGRHLVVSYGISSLTHAIVYDLELKRFGQLRIDHVDCFEYAALSATDTTALKIEELTTSFDEIAASFNGLVISQVQSVSYNRRNIGFLQADGSIKLVNFEAVNPTGLLFLGKYQLSRGRLSTLLSVELENCNGAATVTDLYSVDGKNQFGADVGTALNTDGELLVTGFRTTGLNHILRVAGVFRINSILLTMIAAGQR